METIGQKKGALQTTAINCLFELLKVKGTLSCQLLRDTKLLTNVELTREVTELLAAYLSKAKSVDMMPEGIEHLKMQVESLLQIETDPEYRNKLGGLLKEIDSESQREALVLDPFVI